MVNLHDRSSLESVQQDAMFATILAQQFRVDTVIGPYHLFKRHTP